MTSDEYILAIDCGSTNMKASVFNRELVSLGGASAPVEYSIQDGTHFEMPVESINDSFIGLCHAAAHDAGIGEGQIGALALGSQAQTFAVLDRHGRAKTPFISWMDKRATAEAEELQNLFGAAMHRHCSFPQHMPQLQLAKLLWVQRHTQAGIAETDRVVSLPTFMAMSVGGKHKTDRNLAAMGGAYSLQLGTWWAQVLAHCGIDIDVMGELVDVGTAVSCTPPPGAGKLFANPLRIVYAGNDQTVGAYGNGCGERDMVVTLGTALVVYRFAGLEPGPFHKNGCWGPFPGHGYYELATRDEGCMALDWAMENMLGKRLPRDFDALASTAWEGGVLPEDVFFIPEKVHTDYAWTAQADSIHKAYAVLEGIAFSLKHLIEAELGAAQNIRHITVVGGGSNSDIWLNIIAAAIDKPLKKGRGDALLGAAALAVDEAPPAGHRQQEIICPDPARKRQLQKRYELWQKIRSR